MRFEFSDGAPLVVVEARLNNKGPFNFLVDTGTTKTVVIKRIGQTFGLHRISCGKKKALAGFSAGATMILSKVKSVQVGKARSTDVEVGVQDLQPLCDGVGVLLDGVLGYTLMKDYRVIINYPKRKMPFEKEDESENGGSSKEVK